MADWQVGDLALCVVKAVKTNLKRGCVYRVISVGPVLPFVQGPDVGLELDGVVNPTAYALLRRNWVIQSAVRRITPGAKIEGIEEPRRVKVDA